MFIVGYPSNSGALPNAQFDFTVPTLDPRIAVTRAGTTATRINSSGYVESVAADTPRFDYNATTLASNGLLIEGSKENLYTYTEDFMDPAIWFDNSGTVTRTGNATIAPNGLQEGDVLGFGGNASLGLYRSFTVTIGVEYTVSFWAKSISGVTSGYRVATTARLGGGNVTFTPTTSWQRFSFTRTAASSGAASPVFGVTDTATKELSIWGVQAEVGGIATSYVPCVGATTQTRNADVVSITGSNFSSFWQAGVGGLQVRACQLAITGVCPLVYANDGTADNIIALRGNVANPEFYIKATTDQVQIDAGTLTANTRYGLSAAWASNNCAAAFNGGAAVPDTTATIPTVDRLLIGSDGTNYLNGWVEKIAYWPQRIIDAETQAFSKL